MLSIDGSFGEGGGQILRTALALSTSLGRPFRITRLRARRDRPGLRPQHLAAVRAAAEVAGARVAGATRGSQTLVFTPGPVRPGPYRFDVGTAGSATLVAQTVLPALLTAAGPSTLTVIGGTHNPLAPPFEHLAETYLPLLERMGARVEARLTRRGFYPAGGGEIVLSVRPTPRLAPLRLTERGPVRAVRAEAVLEHLPRHIGERELAVVARRLGLEPAALAITEAGEAESPGNYLLVRVVTEALTEAFAGIGRRGLRAEAVAEGVADAVGRYLAAEVPVGPHLADQLLLPLALAGGGEFLTVAPTGHTRTQLEVIRHFLPLTGEIRALARDRFRIRWRAA